MYRLAFNPTAGPVVSDDDGRTIAGGEWGAVDTTSDAVKSAVDAGRLMLQDAPEGSDIDVGARLAVEQVDRFTTTREALDPLDREALTALARDTLGDDADLPTTKSELLARMVPLGITPPPPAEAPARATRARKEEG